MNKLTAQVPAGLSTYVGYVSSAVLAGLAVWSQTEGSSQTKWLAILAAALAALTNYNRSQQVPKAVVPAEADELAAGTSPVWAAQPTPAPDGVDGPHVPNSGA